MRLSPHFWLIFAFFWGKNNWCCIGAFGRPMMVFQRVLGTDDPSGVVGDQLDSERFRFRLVLVRTDRFKIRWKGVRFFHLRVCCLLISGMKKR